MRAVIGGALRERTVSAEGVEKFRQFASETEEYLLEETYSTPRRELELKLTWNFGFRTEAYRISGRPVTRREYEEDRLKFPGMPPSQGYAGIEEDSVVTIFRISSRAKTEVFHPQPGMISRTTTADDGTPIEIELSYPSGKVIREQFDEVGKLIFRSVKYAHRGSLPDISIETRYSGGIAIEEQYWARRKPSSRRSYESARKHFPDMPEAGQSTPDTLGNLLKLVRQEARRMQQPAQATARDEEKARRIDESCQEILATGCTEARSWIDNKKNTLSTMDRRSSRALISSLYKLGAEAIWLCDVEREGDCENSSNIVIKLPTDAQKRQALLKKTGRLAEQQGFTGQQYHGQTYDYVKLD